MDLIANPYRHHRERKIQMEYMKGEKNKDFITGVSDVTGQWQFWTRSSVTRVADTVAELATAVEKLWNALQPICRVSKCGFIVRVYEQNEYLADALTLTAEEERGFHETVEGETGVDPETLQNRFNTVSDQYGSVYLSYLKTDDIALRVRLRTGDRYITKSDTEFYKSQSYGKIFDKEPHFQPLEILIDYHRNRGEEANVLIIGLKSHTDIWFAGTEAGKVNRQRLVSVFDEIQEQFDVMRTSFCSETTSAQTLQEKGMTGLAFE